MKPLSNMTKTFILLWGFNVVSLLGFGAQKHVSFLPQFLLCFKKYCSYPFGRVISSASQDRMVYTVLTEYLA